MTLMTPDHPRWDEFCDRLEGPEACNFTETAANALGIEWTCNFDHGFAIAILFAMGFSADAIAASIDYWTARGGHCDCEILFNVDPAAREGTA